MRRNPLNQCNVAAMAGPKFPFQRTLIPVSADLNSRLTVAILLKTGSRYGPKFLWKTSRIQRVLHRNDGGVSLGGIENETLAIL
jgi:hypothetical protein